MVNQIVASASNSEYLVLVVDDSSCVSQLIANWLKAANYRVVTALSVDDALQHLNTQRVDVVISDIFMRERTGFDLLSIIKRDFPDTIVLMLTGCHAPHLAAQAMQLGAWGYMLKPMAPEELLFQVAMGIDRRRRRCDSQTHSDRLEHLVQEQNRLIQMAHQETIRRLVVTSMVRDDETGEHIQRIGLMSETFARALGWDEEQIDSIRLAAPMHDIGKVGIPDAILSKPGKLTPREFEIMKTHTVIGAGILKQSQFPMLQMAESIARSHHERWDGAGYPDKLRELEIPEAARVVSIVDFYDALTHDRVYRAAVAEPIVLRMLLESRGTHFDPHLLDCFFDILPRIREVSQRTEEYTISPAHQPSPAATLAFAAPLSPPTGKAV